MPKRMYAQEEFEKDQEENSAADGAYEREEFASGIEINEQIDEKAQHIDRLETELEIKKRDLEAKKRELEVAEEKTRGLKDLLGQQKNRAKEERMKAAQRHDEEMKEMNKSHKEREEKHRKQGETQLQDQKKRTMQQMSVNKTCEREKKRLKRDVDELNMNNKSLKDKAGEYEALKVRFNENERSFEAMADLVREQEGERKALTQKKEELKELQDKFWQNEKEIGRVTKELNQVKKQAQLEQEEYKREETSRSEDLRDKEKEIEGLLERISSRGVAVQEMSSNTEFLKGKLKKLQSDNLHLEEKITREENKTHDTAKLNKRIEELSKAKADLKQQKKDELLNLEKKIGRLVAEKKSLTKEVNDVKRVKGEDNQTKNDRINRTERKVAELTKERDELVERLKDSEMKAANTERIRKERDEVIQEKKVLQEEHNEVMRDNVFLKTRHEALRGSRGGDPGTGSQRTADRRMQREYKKRNHQPHWGRGNESDSSWNGPRGSRDPPLEVNREEMRRRENELSRLRKIVEEKSRMLKEQNERVDKARDKEKRLEETIQSQKERIQKATEIYDQTKAQMQEMAAKHTESTDRTKKEQEKAEKSAQRERRMREESKNQTARVNELTQEKRYLEDQVLSAKFDIEKKEGQIQGLAEEARRKMIKEEEQTNEIRRLTIEMDSMKEVQAWKQESVSDLKQKNKEWEDLYHKTENELQEFKELRQQEDMKRAALNRAAEQSKRELETLKHSAAAKLNTANRMRQQAMEQLDAANAEIKKISKEHKKLKREMEKLEAELEKAESDVEYQKEKRKDAEKKKESRKSSRRRGRSYSREPRKDNSSAKRQKKNTTGASSSTGQRGMGTKGQKKNTTRASSSTDQGDTSNPWGTFPNNTKGTKNNNYGAYKGKGAKTGQNTADDGNGGKQNSHGKSNQSNPDHGSEENIGSRKRKYSQSDEPPEEQGGAPYIPPAGPRVGREWEDEETNPNIRNAKMKTGILKNTAKGPAHPRGASWRVLGVGEGDPIVKIKKAAKDKKVAILREERKRNPGNAQITDEGLAIDNALEFILTWYKVHGDNANYQKEWEYLFYQMPGAAEHEPQWEEPDPEEWEYDENMYQ